MLTGPCASSSTPTDTTLIRLQAIFPELIATMAVHATVQFREHHKQTP